MTHSWSRGAVTIRGVRVTTLWTSGSRRSIQSPQASILQISYRDDFHAVEFGVDDVFARIWQSLDARVNGPLMFRLVMQPLIATALAVREGLADAEAGRPAYFWAILTRPGERRQLLREGWTAVAKVFILAAILETAYEVIVYRWIYPFEALLVSFFLACVPYLLIRGPVNRIAVAARRTRSTV